MTKADREFIEERVGDLCSVIRSISYGGQDRAEGLELLSMAIAGEGIRNPLGDSIGSVGSSISEGLDEVTNALNRIADAMENKCDDRHQ